jgi:hypothetical protein
VVWGCDSWLSIEVLAWHCKKRSGLKWDLSSSLKYKWFHVLLARDVFLSLDLGTILL